MSAVYCQRVMCLIGRAHKVEPLAKRVPTRLLAAVLGLAILLGAGWARADTSHMDRRRRFSWLGRLLAYAASATIGFYLLGTPRTAGAAGVVGTGTAASCTT